jgi:hypothetical protein
MWIDYDDKYAVSEEGLVMHKKLGWITKGVLEASSGYLRHAYNRGGETQYRLVHRMVAEIFLPRIDLHNLEVDHINRDKTDNRASNLRWCSRSVQMLNRNMKLPQSGQKYIRETKYKTWRVHIRFEGLQYFKAFKTLDEAISARDNILAEYNMPR